MLFKNLVFRRLPKEWAITAAELSGCLSAKPLRPCGPFDMSSRGWVPAIHGGQLVHTVNQQQLVALGTDDKLLPGSIVRQVAQERADAITMQQGFPVGRKQMRELRAKVADELKSRALTRRRITHAWFDLRNAWFAVDSAGEPRAEMVIEALGEALGSFVPLRIDAARSPHASMASWLMHGEAPARFGIDDDLELQTADRTKAIIRYTRYPLDGKEIRAHVAAGKYPTRLGMTWNDRLSFVLTDKLQLKKLEFLELGTAGIGTAGTGTAGTDATGEVDPIEQFEADFAFRAGELAAMLKDLTAVLGSAAGHEEEWTSQSKVA